MSDLGRGKGEFGETGVVAGVKVSARERQREQLRSPLMRLARKRWTSRADLCLQQGRALQSLSGRTHRKPLLHTCGALVLRLADLRLRSGLRGMLLQMARLVVIIC